MILISAGVLLLFISTFWFFLNFMHTQSFERKTLKKSDSSLEYPFVSIICYAQNPKTNLQHLINRLQNQHYPKELFEILIVYNVHNESHDQWAKNRPHSIVHVHTIKQTLPLSTNRLKIQANKAAITDARGDWYLFIDENTTLHPLFLTSALNSVQVERVGYLLLLPTYQFRHFLNHFILSYYFSFARLSSPFQVRKKHPLQNTTLPRFHFSGHLVHKEVYLAVGEHHELDVISDEDGLFLNLIRISPFPMNIKYTETLLQVQVENSFLNLYDRFIYARNHRLRTLPRALVHSSLICFIALTSFALPLYSLIQGYFQAPFFSSHYAAFIIYSLQFLILISAHWIYFYTLKTSVFFSFFYPLGYFIHCANLWHIAIKDWFSDSKKPST